MSYLCRVLNLALIGFMGNGRSSVGQWMATALRFKFVDRDEIIEALAGQSICDIFARQALRQSHPARNNRPGA